MCLEVYYEFSKSKNVFMLKRNYMGERVFLTKLLPTFVFTRMNICINYLDFNLMMNSSSASRHQVMRGLMSAVLNLIREIGEDWSSNHRKYKRTHVVRHY